MHHCMSYCRWYGEGWNNGVSLWEDIPQCTGNDTSMAPGAYPGDTFPKGLKSVHPPAPHSLLPDTHMGSRNGSSSHGAVLFPVCCRAWTERFMRRSGLTKPSGATTARGSLAARTAKRMSLQGSAARLKARSSGSTSSLRISSGVSVQSTRIMSESRLARRRLHSRMYLCSSPGSKGKVTLPVPTGSA